MPSEDSNQTANAHADLNPRCAYMSEGTFSDVEAQIIYTMVICTCQCEKVPSSLFVVVVVLV